jgi:hypothetical protein
MFNLLCTTQFEINNQVGSKTEVWKDSRVYGRNNSKRPKLDSQH